MSRGKYNHFEPAAPPPNWTPPGAKRKFEAPIVVDTTVDVDKAKRRLSITANYSITSADHFVGVDTSNGAVTLTLPATSDVAEGKIYIIKDEGGNAATNNIIINTADSAEIDSLNAVSLVSNYGAISIYFNASDWHIY
jgi:hypothetical protein